MIKIHLIDGSIIESATSVDEIAIYEMLNPNVSTYKVCDRDGSVYFRPTDVMFIEVV